MVNIVKQLINKSNYFNELINLPDPYVIVMEENRNVTNAYEVIIRNPSGDGLRYWEYDLLIKEIKNDIFRVTKEILEHIEIIYKDEKIEVAEFNEFAVVIANLTIYLCQEIDKLSEVEEVVTNMVKTFYDPEVEKRGEKRAIEKVAINMLKKGKSIQDIIEATELTYEKILELKGKYIN